MTNTPPRGHGTSSALTIWVVDGVKHDAVVHLIYNPKGAPTVACQPRCCCRQENRGSV